MERDRLRIEENNGKYTVHFNNGEAITNFDNAREAINYRDMLGVCIYEAKTLEKNDYESRLA